MWPKQAGGTGEEGPTLFEQRVGAIMGDTALSGVVGAHVVDSDYPQGKYLCFCVTHSKRVHTVTSAEVRRGKGEAD